ncbi:MAG: glycerol-3-phosphate 1-O-acyltransferase PlsY [candidate division Zixibacteria bacterium]|jgi:glycerol-3-phosphate acyltransferase PlsY|nr:glycerol-3-phosphate 1-O-acyltransferase PlsY [candidate division Zixibacteria bacterium]
MELARTILPVLAAYLLGAIPFALIITRLAGIDDLRKHGSGNLGATNVWRVAGGKVAAVVFALDIGKGVLAIMLARLAGQSLIDQDLFLVICAAAAVIGHIFPVYIGFKGGKGVNTALGVMIMLLPLETLIALVVFLIVVILSRMISLGSIVAALVLPVAVTLERFVLERPVALTYLVLTVFLSLAVVVAHRSNIARIAAGTENRLTFGTKPRKDAPDG